MHRLFATALKYAQRQDRFVSSSTNHESLTWHGHTTPTSNQCILYYVRTISHISHSPHPSCFSLQASSRQRVAAGQACSPGEPAPTWTPWTPVSLQDTRASPVKVGDQLEGGVATHRPIRGGANVLPSISLFFLLSPFSVSHPGHWINTEEE